MVSMARSLCIVAQEHDGHEGSSMSRANAWLELDCNESVGKCICRLKVSSASSDLKRRSPRSNDTHRHLEQHIDTCAGNPCRNRLLCRGLLSLLCWSCHNHQPCAQGSTQYNLQHPNIACNTQYILKHPI